MSICSRSRPSCRFQNSAARIRASAELADAARALRPARRVGGEIGEMLLIVEARHGIVGLRLEIGARQRALAPARIEERAAAPPAMRLCTSAVMNTVLPERASPVTPSLTVGSTRPVAKSPMLRKASAAAWVKVEIGTPRTVLCALGALREDVSTASPLMMPKSMRPPPGARKS